MSPMQTVSPVRVLHFVTGGFSGGATQVAVQLVNAAREGDAIEPLLVLRRKRRTPPQRISELERAGTPLRLVPGWSHAASIFALARICREFRPDVLVAHGFSEKVSEAPGPHVRDPGAQGLRLGKGTRRGGAIGGLQDAQPVGLTLGVLQELHLLRGGCRSALRGRASGAPLLPTSLWRRVAEKRGGTT